MEPGGLARALRADRAGARREPFDAVTAEMADAALESGSPGFNPRVPGAAEIVALYERAYGA